MHNVADIQTDRQTDYMMMLMVDDYTTKKPMSMKKSNKRQSSIYLIFL